MSNQVFGRNLAMQIDGTANTPLFHRIMGILNEAGDGYRGDALVSTFADGETRIEIDTDVSGHHVFVIQPTSPPVNDNLMRLYLILDALKRGSCASITAVIPYFAYARQDKKLHPFDPISARAVANLIETCGVDRVITLDLHSNQTQGYFNCPVHDLQMADVFMKHILENISLDTIIVSPDVGGVSRSVAYARYLGVGTAIIHKSRLEPNKVAKMTLLGDVAGKTVIIVDDMIDTAGTLCKAAELLKRAGARIILAYATHGLFSRDAVNRIAASVFDHVYISDSINIDDRVAASEKISVLSCADLLAKAIIKASEPNCLPGFTANILKKNACLRFFD